MELLPLKRLGECGDRCPQRSRRRLTAAPAAHSAAATAEGSGRHKALGDFSQPL